jgi:hypothetical protein
MAHSEIAAILAKGADLRAADVDDLRAALTQLDPDEYDQVAGDAWEGVALIVNDPAYEGDAKVPAPADA